MIEAPDFLPLGSIVSLKGNTKKLMVLGRGLVFKKDDGTKEYYDYSFCLYPHGMIGDAVIYSNHDCIDTVFYRGYRDEEEEQYLSSVIEVLSLTDVPKANPQVESEW